MKCKLILTLIIMACMASARAQVTPEEKQALQDLYNATNGPNWATETDGFIGDEWNFEDIVTNSWYGVTVANGHVVELDLEFNDLSGNIPASIGDLVHLTRLNLSTNELMGNIPNEIGNIVTLQILDLFNNQLSGNIPSGLGNLSMLEQLFLGNNDLTGPLPPQIGNLSNLLWLSAGSNSISGQVPVELENLSNLNHLHLGNNSLQGNIPSQWGNMVNLEYLNLSKNTIGGLIPPELGNLSNLKTLVLYENNLSGNIPAEFGNLSSLQHLYLYTTNIGGAIPVELGNLLNMEWLFLHQNTINGSIPSEIGNLTNLKMLFLQENEISGNIPQELGGLTDLTSLYLSENNISGEIPVEFGNLSSLTLLDLNSNNLSGAIPPELGNLSNLSFLRLNSNQLTGTIPAELGNCTNLEQIYVQNNNLSGIIPQEVFGLNLLTTFHIRNNKFDFGHMEFFFQNWFEYILNHAPQQKTDQSESFETQLGADMVLTTAISGTQNHYQWYKDGEPINGAPDTHEYQITNAVMADAGTYHCVMTSDIVNGLTLTRHNIVLEVNDLVPDQNPEENWNMITVWDYDLETNLKASARSYYNELGKHVQTQRWDVVTKNIWGQATLYDFQGRPALSTLSAPIMGQFDFLYHDNFITNQQGQTYTTQDFETDPYAPATVLADGPLGNYYQGITSPLYQDSTPYPFVRTIFSELNPGKPLAQVGGHKVDTNGDDQITTADTWPQAYSFTLPASNELSLDVAFGEAKYTTIKTLKTVTRDVHGNENVVFMDTDGKRLASARSGIQGALSPQMDLFIGAQGYVDVHIPRGVQTGLTTNNNNAVSVYNLITDAPEPTPMGNLPAGFYRVAVNDPNNYQPNTIFVQYHVNYYDYSLNEYDETGRLVANYQPVTDNNGNKLVSNHRYNTLGQLTETASPDEGVAKFKYRSDGQIRFSQNSEQALWKEVSYTDYDRFGRPVESGVLESAIFKDLDPDAPLPDLTKREVVFTTYDFLTDQDKQFLNTLPPGYQNPSFLAGNVAKTANKQVTTYYSYDGYGRVRWLVQDVYGLGPKTLDYDYEPRTGLVRHVAYQKGQDDQFTHQYAYDQRNQLLEVKTSTDGENFVLHARYFYDEAGTLVRTELAEGAQGLDYVYTLSGQLKGINHPTLDPANDPGGDMNDFFGMQLDYHLGDYQRAGNPNIGTAPEGDDQYNGNIKGIRWQTRALNIQESHYTFSYDRNNWLTGANFAPQEPNGKEYDVYGLGYDANGNLQGLVRNKDKNDLDDTSMDQLTYHYDPKKPNRLLWVDDAVPEVPDADDLDDQPEGNYKYNSIGQLVRDFSQQITYLYTTSGLVKEVQQFGLPLVKFLYNDRNQRVKKETYANGNLMYTTYYVRDVAGQAMAVYSDVGGNPDLAEQPVYGAGRIGIAYNGNNNQKNYVYELTDHLGNIRVVFTKEDNDAVLEGFTDYYPGGMAMPNRNLEDANGYRFGYQGQFAEEDDETDLNAFQLRMYDSRILRWLSPDPHGQFASPYLAMGNRPQMLVDPDGGCTVGVDCPTEFDWMGEGTWVMDEIVLGSNGDFSTGVLWGSDSIGIGGLFDFSLQSQSFWEGLYSNQDWRSNMLTFDGKDLMIDYDPPSEDIWRSVHVIPATSGKGEFMNDQSAQHRQDLGPIPEGVYAFSNTSWDKLSTIRQYYNIVRGNGDWGRYNAPLIPLSYNGARHSFYIHGGYFEGSAGCIDCGGHISTVYDITKNWNYTLLRVKYD